ncbi:MAG: 3'(2'),5'-bisphosphate nucleotidase CysQ, partial [Alphaproteobacteria bacterium]|nr:3'(2'),5'-bisphosphate nucleotidase CysQ [Alphaproteobacteria bacterium]
MDASDHARLVAAVVPLALEAGAVILRHYGGAFEVRSKRDSSPVTLADEEAERLIVAGLRALTPAIPVVAEEEVAAGAVTSVGDQPFWLVDPLDGTKEFVARNGEFTVNIALVAAGVPVLGVVHAPARSLTYTAHGPGTAMRAIGGGAPASIAVRAPPADGIVVVSSRSHNDRERLRGLVGERPVAAWQILGSSLKFCHLAEGAADLYPRYGATSEWDTAAGHAVLAAAGGAVATLDGGPLGYGKPGFLNGG